MRHVLACVLVIVGVGTALAAGPAEHPVLTMERRVMEAWLQGNPDVGLAMTDPAITYIHAAIGTRLDGLPAVKALFETYRGRPLFDRYDIVDPAVVEAGDVAVLTYQLTTQNGSLIRRWHTTEVFRNGPAGWRIIHTHISQAGRLTRSRAGGHGTNGRRATSDPVCTNRPPRSPPRSPIHADVQQIHPPGPGLPCRSRLSPGVRHGAGAAAQAPPPQTPPDSAKVLAAAREIIGQQTYCALITLDASGLPQIRTMNPFPPDEEMVVWMATNTRSRKVEEIRKDPRVSLYYADHVKPTGYVAITGKAVLVDDMQEVLKRKRAYWDTSFPGLKNLVLIKVIPERIDVINYKQGLTGDPVTWRTTSIPAPGKGAAERQP